MNNKILKKKIETKIIDPVINGLSITFRRTFIYCIEDEATHSK